MMHFQLPADHKKRKPAPVLAIAAPLTPSRYLVLRRDAAKLTQRQLAQRLAHRRRMLDGATGDTIRMEAAFLDLVQQLETPRATARLRDTIETLAEVLPFDPDVYWQLAHDPAERHPFVCLGCGCSTYDPCSGSEGVCSCATAHACTRCIGRTIDLAEAA